MKVEIGKKYWYCRLKFTSNGTTYRSTRPVELEIVKIEPLIGDSRYSEVTMTAPGGKKSKSFILRSTEELPSYFFETREEAIEAWNRTVLDELDKALSVYETRRKKILRKKIEVK